MPLRPAARRVIAAAAAAVLLTTGALFSAGAASAAPPLPTRMAALGDSITQASMTCSILYICPSNSWATGTTASVQSHAVRLRAAGAQLTAYNDAVPGAVAANLPAQAAKAVSQRAGYVTIEIGANDACTDTVAQMTSTASFEASVRSALQTLAASPSAPQIFVASVPDLKHLWSLNKGSLSARLAWATLKFCDSMLKNPTSTAAADVQRRDAVQQRVNEYNAVLQRVCAQTVRCRWDGGVVAGYAFTKADVSTRDYFHPSLSGQATLSRMTWSVSPWVT